MTKKIPLKHPGQMLKIYFLTPMHISQYKLAKFIGVPQIRISEIVRGIRSISPDTAFRLGKFFKMSANFWLNLQNNYDLDIAKDKTSSHKISILKIKDIKMANSIMLSLHKKFQ